MDELEILEKYFYTIFNKRMPKYWDCMHILVANSFTDLNRSMKPWNRVVYRHIWLMKDEKWLPYGSVLLIILGENSPEKKEEPEPSLRCLELGRAPPKPRILHRARQEFCKPFASQEQSRSGEKNGSVNSFSSVSLYKMN